MTGFLNLLKPPGMTSHDAVNVVRRVIGTRQVGHAGTLDPGAAGVLVLAVGFAVRLIPYLPDSSKSYRAEVTFGVETETGDAQGTVTRLVDCPDLTEARLRAALPAFIGDISQTPPTFSAVQIGGRRAHQMAREGIAVTPPPRRVTVHQLSLVRFQSPRALLEVDCSSGTYIRSLAVDLGTSLGGCAHLSFLLRTRVGRFQLADALTLEQLRNVRPDEAFMPVRDALAPIPTVCVEEALANRVRHGHAVELTLPPASAETVYVMIADTADQPLAVARRSEQQGALCWQPCCVVPEEER